MARKLSPEDLLTPWLRLLLYGQPGSTKTRTAGTAAAEPRTSPVLWLDVAGNPESLRSYEQKPDIIRLDKMADLNEPYDWLVSNQPSNHVFAKNYELRPGYKCVVVDGVTEIQRFAFQVAVGTGNVLPGNLPKTAERQHFNQVLGGMVNFAREYYKLPMHVIFTSLERMDRDESTGIVQYFPLLWGQSAGEVPGYALTVARMVHRARIEGRMEKEITEANRLKIIEDTIGADTVSVALFRPSGKYAAKDQTGMLPPYMTNPSIPKMVRYIWGSSGA